MNKLTARYEKDETVLRDENGDLVAVTFNGTAAEIVRRFNGAEELAEAAEEAEKYMRGESNYSQLAIRLQLRAAIAAYQKGE